MSKWVEVTGAITSELHCLCAKILDGKTRWIKFNGSIIVTGELLHGDEVLN
jgi:hypothetical protein